MRRPWIALVLLLLLAVGLSTLVRSTSLAASNHVQVVAAKKKCHYVVKKVHGKKKRVKVCRTVASPIATATSTNTPTSTPPPTATALPTATSTPTPVPTATPTQIPLDTFGVQVDAVLQQQHFQGSALILRAGQVIFARGYGLADAAHGISNTPETAFRLASVSKQFIAVSILQLAEHNKLALQDPICKYLPSCPASWQAITIEECLVHTSGIPSIYESEVPDFNANYPYTIDQVVSFVQPRPLLFAPGSKYQYSSSGYAVLVDIIQRVSGESYAAYAKTNIFDTADMSHTGTLSDNSRIPYLAIGYQDNQPMGPEQGAYSDSNMGATGGLYSSAQDMGKWLTALLSGRLLSSQSLNSMWAPHVTISDPVGSGYGWATQPYYCRPRHIVWGAGAMPGVRTQEMVFPDDGIGIVLLSNTSAAIDPLGSPLAQLAIPNLCQ